MISISKPIAVIAPSGRFDPDRLDKGIRIVESKGYAFAIPPELQTPHRYLAATDAQRMTQLRNALLSPDYGAIWIARGGFGLTRLLDDLRLENAIPKPIIGFSDVTALFCALHQEGLGPLIHGPVIHSLPATDTASVQHLFDLIGGKAGAALAGECWIEGNATGGILGGNLTMLASGCGTKHQLNAEGAILILEDIGEAAYRLDRSLQQLKSSGVFNGVVGIGLGQFTDCSIPTDATWTLRDVITEQLRELNIPVIGNLPIGHGPQNHAFVWGAPGQIKDGVLSQS